MKLIIFGVVILLFSASLIWWVNWGGVKEPVIGNETSEKTNLEVATKVDLESSETIKPKPEEENSTPEASSSLNQPTASPAPIESETPTTDLSPAEIKRWYGDLIPLTLGDLALEASVADTRTERELGLSDTPSLPANLVKLFVFDTSDTWSFWMKEMSYPIDIIWLAENKQVVYIKSVAEPSSYPQLYLPTSPAKYVIETKAGLAEKNNIKVGTMADW